MDSRVGSWFRVPGPAFTLALLLWASPASAQGLARFSLDSVVAIDQFAGQATVNRPNIIIDVTGVLRLGEGWLIYVRPWFRQPRAPEWEKEIYQAALQYERPGPLAVRVDLGYLASPVGLGMMDTRPGVNPTIAPHLSYVTSMPVFDPGAPRIRPIAATYPLGGQFTLSSQTWDARVAVVNSAPTRNYVINGEDNPRATPVLEAGAGVTPRIGLRFGVSFATGDYVTGEELAVPATDGRELRMISVEGEYAFGYTKISGELTRDALETAIGSETAYAWFVQGVQTLAPRWFVAACQEGSLSPPLRTGTVVGSRRTFHTIEATVGFRASADFTLRSSFMNRKAFTRDAWDQQIGASLVWAHRWW